ncbi:unnamed protein product [Chironomus riparius]|uniref:Uncharacterized protein n=1 Tax=Chironomus riparius TaxID=315576 RepID=A0A9N9RJ60_9DIPT|nr:unnamed protein product [Chironomus riparius]
MEKGGEQKLMNAALMRKYLNRPGRLFVKIFDTSSGGKQIQGMSTDKQRITVELDTPLDQPLQGWIEVVGMATSSNVFRAYEIICFEQNENQEPFDEESHNEICQIFDLLRDGDLYKFKN